jgi:hypothetical protein
MAQEEPRGPAEGRAGVRQGVRERVERALGFRVTGWARVRALA